MKVNALYPLVLLLQNTFNNWGERVSAVELLAFVEDEAFYN